VDLRGNSDDILARLDASITPRQDGAPSVDEPRGKGRPKLGVIAREVTLLPRHWAWLASQPGGASVVLRRLVDEARRTDDAKGRTRGAQEAAYRFMSAGNLPYYEEALRALFANDRARFEQIVAPWPKDIHFHAIQLAFGAGDLSKA
jgi:uncharacterized protein